MNQHVARNVNTRLPYSMVQVVMYDTENILGDLGYSVLGIVREQQAIVVAVPTHKDSCMRWFLTTASFCPFEG